jgi:hypothetical protein
LRRLTGKLTYANVVSTLCLFLLLGGAAVAASTLGKNTVGPKQLKKNAVTAAKLKSNAVTTAKLKDAAVTGAKLADGAVTNAKLADGSVTGAKVADGSLTGADVNQSTLTAVRAANVTSISISGDATCTPELPVPAGVTSERPSEGNCLLTFPTPQTTCTFEATVHLHLAPNVLVVVGDRTAFVSNRTASPNSIIVSTLFKGEKSNLPFDLVQVC